ncbi:hypothetical protein BCR32DRAFT_296149 [Anaeromyces robustus]|uniref:Uncharacterized protein n=1 Tax=Anaeromyces robustus TaxID=1754192 RepID=A0A1Y1WSV7_9FUNG|nr:hypothetical protein BCR32DRAFT_296149 [Anaeromyces robustus]|eukprot:ORX76613.1 hypothetical protein BCR32DRAFT_296149 [Anaeromyces robustus]
MYKNDMEYLSQLKGKDEELNNLTNEINDIKKRLGEGINDKDNNKKRRKKRQIRLD